MSIRKVVLATIAGLTLSFAGTQVARADALDDMRKEKAAQEAKEAAEEKAKKDAEAKAEAEEKAKKAAGDKAEWDEAKKKAGALKEAMGGAKDSMGDALRARLKDESPMQKLMREAREAQAKKEKDAADKANKDSLLNKLGDKGKDLNKIYQTKGVKGLAAEGAKELGDLFKKKDDPNEPKERTLMDELKEKREKEKAAGGGETMEEMMKRKMGGK